MKPLRICGRNRREDAAERYPGGAVLAFTLHEDIAGLAPREDGARLVIEDEVTPIRADHENGMTFIPFVNNDGHSHRSAWQASLSQQLALKKLEVLAISRAVLGEVPAIRDAPMVAIRERSTACSLAGSPQGWCSRSWPSE